jgi:hypothetical protein
MEAAGADRLDSLKASLLEASRQSNSPEGFEALHKSLGDILGEYSRAQRESKPVYGWHEKVVLFNDNVSKARQQLQAKCEVLQVRYHIIELMDL